jgi:outer membrane lipoprotein-sorting protein
MNTDHDRHIDDLLGNVLKDDVPADVERQLRSQLEDFRSRLGQTQPPGPLAARPAASIAGGVQAEPRRRAPSLFYWRRIMRHPVSRVAAASFLVLAFVGVAAWLHGTGATPALADFLAPILDARTAKYKMTCVERGGTTTAEVMVLAPNRTRLDEEHPNKRKTVFIMDGDQGKTLTLHPARKLAIVITDVNVPKERKERASNDISLDLRSQLRDFRGRPDYKRQPLGEKDIHGRHVVGYRLTGHGLVMDLWGDPKTGLPVRVESTAPSDPHTKIVQSDFVFNVDLDESLFSLEPPAGYKVEYHTCDLSPAQEKDLVETFRRYTQLSRGAFPDTLDQNDEFEDLFSKRWAESHLRAGRELSEQQIQKERQERQDERMKLTRGIAFAFDILPPEADAHYAGKGISLGTAGKPVFWYRPEGAKKYRVIYADLSVRDADTPPSVPDAQPLPGASSSKR